MPNISIELIKPGNNQRSYFDPDEMEELANSIRSIGILQPILVTPLGENGEFQIVVGERRWRAAKMVGLSEIPATVREFSLEEAEIATLTENVQRASMSPAEEAEAAQMILYRNQNDKEETARLLGWSIDTLNKRLALMSCAKEVRDALTERKIQLGHAELLAAVPADKQVKALKKIIEGKISISVLKENLGKLAHKLASAIFDTAQCQQCPYNSSQQKSLGFSENIGDGYCTNGTHYEELTAEKLESLAAEKRGDFPKVVIYKKEDGFQPLPLTADGTLGVGAEQAEACKACANYGCAISALPGTEGEITEDLCFDAACNHQKVAARMKAEKIANRGAATTANATSDNEAAPTRPHVASANTISKAITNYRVEQWRKIAAKELLVQRDKAQSLVIGLALTGHLDQVDQPKFRAALERKLDDLPKALGLADAIDLGVTLSAEQRGEALALIPCAAAFGVPEHDLVKLMAYLGVNVTAHWKLNKAFLDLMTKSEIESIANELGLKKALKDQFAKLRDGKKDAFIAALLKVEGFEYQGAVPKIMFFDKIKRGGSATVDAVQMSTKQEPEPLPESPCKTTTEEVG